MRYNNIYWYIGYIFENPSNIKIHENQFSGSWAVPCRQPKVHQHFYNNPTLYQILSQMNPIESSTFFFKTAILEIFFCLLAN
jgi:hypothetical protein